VSLVVSFLSCSDEVGGSGPAEAPVIAGVVAVGEHVTRCRLDPHAVGRPGELELGGWVEDHGDLLSC
jgi:hypothetical protein